MQNPSLISILAWAVATITIQLLPLCDALIFMADGSKLLRLIPPTMLIAYASIQCTIPLILSALFIKIVRSFWEKLIVWTLSLWLYFLFVEYKFFWAIGRWEGYPFLNPLLPFAIYPWICFPSWPVPLLLLCYCILTSTIAGIILQLKPKKAFVFIFILLIFTSFLLYQPKKEINCALLHSIGHLPISFANSSCELICALLDHEIDMILKKNPTITTIILPESSWNSTSIQNLPLLPMRWNGTLIIGSFGKLDNIFFNRIYYFNNRKIQNIHDKTHLIPLTETPIDGIAHLNKKLYFSKSPPLSPSNKKREHWHIYPLGICIPTICSEFFCNLYNIPNIKHCWHLVLANDYWFRITHFQLLMALKGRFNAMLWQHSVLYISYYYAQGWNCNGSALKIGTTPPERFID